jgi:hypothetical protein
MNNQIIDLMQQKINTLEEILTYVCKKCNINLNKCEKCGELGATHYDTINNISKNDVINSNIDQALYDIKFTSLLCTKCQNMFNDI